MFRPTRQHALLHELAAQANVPVDDPRLTGAAVALYGASGNGGRVGAAGLPDDYRHVTLTNSPARATEAEAYRLIDAYAETFARVYTPEQSTIKSLYLWSEAKGNGKTTTACALANEWIRASYLGAIKAGEQPAQRPALFFDVNEWLIDYNLIAMGGGNNDGEVDAFKAKMKRAATVPFLVMDDLGVRESSPKFRGYMHYIVNHRTTNRLPTVFTSNKPIEEMADVFDERLYDRMRDRCVVIEMQGESRRGLRK